MKKASKELLAARVLGRHTRGRLSPLAPYHCVECSRYDADGDVVYEDWPCDAALLASVILGQLDLTANPIPATGIPVGAEVGGDDDAAAEAEFLKPIK